VARQSLFHHRLDAFAQRKHELEEVIHSSAELERELRNELVTLDAQATTAAAEMASRREEMLARPWARSRDSLNEPEGLCQ